MGFIFGGETGLTYEDLQRKRKVADALAMSNLRQAPANVGEGLTAIGRALAARAMTKRLDKRDSELRDEFGSQWDIAMGLTGGALGGTAGDGTSSAFGGEPFDPPEYNIDEADPRRSQFPTGSASTSDLFTDLEKQYGLPSGYLARTAQIESGGNPNAQNPNSSAGGMFQFIDSTAKQYGLTNKNDPRASADAAARLARDNAQVLRQALGREPTAAELYLAHQQGAGGAVRLLTNPNAPAASVVGGDAVNLNGGSSDMTAGQFANKWLGKFDGGGMQPDLAKAVQLASLAQSPYATDQQKLIAQMLLQQAQQANDPLRRMQLEKGALELEQMRNPKPTPRDTQYIEGVGLIDKQTGEVIQQFDASSAANIDGESALRKEFTGLQPVKDFTTQADAYGRIVAAARDPSPAGDLSLIFNFMKVLDPGSVVRESEFATAESAAAWMQESEEAGAIIPRPIANAIRKINTGQRLSPEQRRDFVSQASALYGQAERQHENIAEQYGTTADAYRYDRDRTIPDFRYKDRGAPITSQRPPSAVPARSPLQQPAPQPTPQPAPVATPQPAPQPAPLVGTNGKPWAGPSPDEIRAMDVERLLAIVPNLKLDELPPEVAAAIVEMIDNGDN